MPLSTFDYYSLGHAARELNVSQSTLYQCSRAGKVPTRRASDGSRLFTPADLEKARAYAKRTRRAFVE